MTPESIQRPPTTVSRRRFLGLGAVGLALGSGLVLTGCGDDSAAAAGPQLVALFNPSRVIAAGIPQRLPFGLIDNGIRLTGDGESLPARVLLDGQLIDTVEVVGRVVAHDHPAGTEEHQHSGLLRYYALRTVLPEPGVYDIEIDIEGVTASAPVQAFDPGEIAVLLPGAEFPAIETATLDDPRDVDRLCTQPDGPCPFHSRSAAEVVASGQPMALLVATPAFCVTAYCGPVLDTLIAAAAQAPHVAMVHVEPYANITAVGGDVTNPDLRLAEAMVDLGLDFEPVLFLVDRNGVLVDRIDNVFDDTELAMALASLT